MRVVAGTARGRRLQVPPGEGVRPTGDRVREAVFNALWSRGAVEGAHVLDLFAGSGALGIEALSRGAAHATFVEADRRALATVRANLDATGLGDRATLVPGDALTHLRSHSAADVRWDVALCDPPYRFERWDDVLGALRADLVVVETDRPLDVPAPWEVAWHRRYGTTVVSFLVTADPSTVSSTEDRSTTDRSTTEKE